MTAYGSAGGRGGYMGQYTGYPGRPGGGPEATEDRDSAPSEGGNPTSPPSGDDRGAGGSVGGYRAPPGGIYSVPFSIE